MKADLLGPILLVRGWEIVSAIRGAVATRYSCGSVESSSGELDDIFITRSLLLAEFNEFPQSWDPIRSP